MIAGLAAANFINIKTATCKFKSGQSIEKSWEKAP